MKQHHLIIGLALAAWLAGAIASKTDPPPAVIVAGSVTFAVATVALVAFLIVRGSGWGALAGRFPPRARFSGPWRTVGTFLIGREDSFQPLGTRLRFVVRAGATPTALHLSARFPFSLVLSQVELPWSEVASCKAYDAGGWMTPLGEPGQLVQLEYDFSYRGTFLQIAVREGGIYLHLPADALGEGRAYVPATETAARQ